MKQDRFLLGILIFIALLVIVALGLFFLRQADQTYGSENTPEGVVRNYALAVQNMDVQRAYTYLADQPNKPTYEIFRTAFLYKQVDASRAALQVGDAKLISPSEALVPVTVVYSSTDPFSAPWSDNQNASLIKQGTDWKLTFMPSPYWGYDWYTLEPAKVP